MAVTSKSYTVNKRTLIFSGVADQNLSGNVQIHTSANAYLGGPKQQVFPITSSADVTMFDVWLGDDVYADCTYSGGSNDVDTITVDATGGYFTISTRSGTVAEWSTALSATVSAANFQTAIRLHPGYASATVTGGPGDSGGTTPYVLTNLPAAVGDKGNVTVRTGDLSYNNPLTGGATTVALVHTTAGSDPTPTAATVTVLSTGATSGY